jgi:hypothetical protein
MKRWLEQSITYRCLVDIIDVLTPSLPTGNVYLLLLFYFVVTIMCWYDGPGVSDSVAVGLQQRVFYLEMDVGLSS